MVIGAEIIIAPSWLMGARTVKYFHCGDGDANMTPDGEFTVAISSSACAYAVNQLGQGKQLIDLQCCIHFYRPME